MENLDLMIEIERYMVVAGLTPKDSIADLIEALAEEE